MILGRLAAVLLVLCGGVASAQVGALRGRSELLGSPLAPSCAITTASLPNGSVGAAYSQTPATANCTAPVAWTVAAGSLCSGLNLNGSTGAITGTPTISQTCSFTVQVADSTTATATQPYSITISAAGSIMGGRSLSGGASKR